MTKLAHQLFIDVSEILQFCYLEQDVLAFYSNHILLKLLLFPCGSNLPCRTLSNEELTLYFVSLYASHKIKKKLWENQIYRWCYFDYTQLFHQKSGFFTTKKHLKYSKCKILGTLFWRIINAEFSLQSASHNSHINHQHQSWSQIRKLWESFIIRCYLMCYA